MTTYTTFPRRRRGTDRGRRRSLPARRGIAIAVALASAVLASGCQDGQLPRVSGEAAPQIGAAVDVVMLQYLDEQQIPGATVAVTKNGRLVLSKGYGVADLDSGRQMEPWHRTRIGSVSKVLTAIAALQLVEQGELDLDGHLYGSSATPIWGADPEGTPGVLHANDAVLEDAGRYLAVAAEAVQRRVPAPGDDTTGLPAYLTQGNYQANVAELLDWMSEVEVRHALSHTAGYLRNGSGPAAATRFDKDELDVTYPEVHETMMAGATARPFRFRPGNHREYSNHGFGLLGQVVAERSGVPYVDYVRANLLQPLGLHDVVPVDVVHLQSERDAAGYDLDEKSGLPIPPLPENVIERDEPAISTSTGGWAATAQDVARIVCGVDVASNHRRLLDLDTAATMVSPAVPELSSKWVLGWDERYTTPSVTKNGATPRGGGARVTKYLPGGLDDAEINVVVNINRRGSPPVELLRTIGLAVAEAEVAADFDLFPASHRCQGEAPTLDITQPGHGGTFRLGEEIHAEAIARDHTGRALPVTWSLPDGRRIDAVPSPSDGTVSLFTDAVPVGKDTLRASARDAGGHEVTDEVMIEVVHDAPTVSIVTPGDAASVPADTDLLLVGHSTMGTHFTLADDQVMWELRRGGEVVHEASGHVATVPADHLQPGGHTLVFTGSDGVASSSAQVALQVEGGPGEPPRRGRPSSPAPGGPTTPPGGPGVPGGPGGPGKPGGPGEPDAPDTPWQPAVATIELPVAGGPIASGPGGTAVAVELAGSAVDVTGEVLDGTRLRWIMTKIGQAPEALCEGSHFAASDQGPDEPVVDCGSLVTDLLPEPVIGGSGTSFVLALEARASDGTVAKDFRVLTVIIPPAG
ncbi:serine hydrolase domain-containing protein [Egicoccus sp. AB-alg2]|uniref:serine hydrolase domain-containing protein n=1 Tax=Egicoccus sp. AB-alg2 TaxID=3242693 RepID=UPI00359DA2B0